MTVCSSAYAKASDFHFRAGGGPADAARNSAAILKALQAADHVELPYCPDNDTFITPIVQTLGNRITGRGPDRTVIQLASGSNGRGFSATGFTRPIYEGFTLDMNAAGNTGSGAHDGLYVKNCILPTVQDVRVIGARGLYQGTPVGAALSIDGGYGANILNNVFEDGYDAYVITNHPGGYAKRNRLLGQQRCGALIGPGADRFHYVEEHAEGNCKTAAGAQILILGAHHVKGSRPVCVGTTGNFGHNIQHNGANYWGLDDPTTSGAGISNIDVYMSNDGHLKGGTAFGAVVRNLEDDSGSNGNLFDGLTSSGAGHVDISAFESNSTFRECTGNFLGWARDQSGTYRSSFLIIGGHAANTITLMQNACRDVELAHIMGTIVDPGGHAISHIDCPHYQGPA